MSEDAALPQDGLTSTFGSRLFYNTCSAMNLAFFTLGYGFRFEGYMNVPMTGPLLLVANHQSYLDPPLIGLALRRHLIFLARKSLFRNRFFRWLIRALNAVPIDQDGIGKEGIKAIMEQLKYGKAVLVFPEGSRTLDGKMEPLRPGVHLLIKRSLAPIVPVGVAGAYEAWPPWRKYPLFSPLCFPPNRQTIAVSVGKPIDARRFAEMPREEALVELQREIQAMQCRAEELRRK